MSERNNLYEMPSHIEEYFSNVKDSNEQRASKELFKGDKDIELRTDIDVIDIVYINAMMLNDKVLSDKGLKPVFKPFYENLMKLRVSKDRLSRGEFVKINSQDRSDELVQGMQTAGTLFGGVKK